MYVHWFQICSPPGEEDHDPLCLRAPSLIHTLTVPLQLHQWDGQCWSSHLHPLPGKHPGIKVSASGNKDEFMHDIGEVVQHDLAFITYYTPAGGLFGPVPVYHVCVDDWKQCVRGRQAVWRLQHHGEPPVSTQTQRRRDSSAAGSDLKRILHCTPLTVSSYASFTCVQPEYSPMFMCDAKTRPSNREFNTWYVESLQRYSQLCLCFVQIFLFPFVAWDL